LYGDCSPDVRLRAKASVKQHKNLRLFHENGQLLHDNGMAQERRRKEQLSKKWKK